MKTNVKPQILRTPQDMQTFRKQQAGVSCGFVPTMGALHAGHAELLDRSRNENQLSVLSVFVNPTQFNDPQDFQSYPSTWESDLKLAQAAGVDVVFAPLAQLMYPDEYSYQVSEKKFSTDLCGANRVGHFDGVLTVVLKLLQIVQPERAYFGEKDYQQLELIRGLQRSFFLPVEIVGVPTVREKSGLAMSSRNLRLTPTELALAPRFAEILRQSLTAEKAAVALTEMGFRVDYVKDVRGRRFGAAHLGTVRLIDNIPWPNELSEIEGGLLV